MTIIEKNHNLSHRMTHELGRAIVCGTYRSNHHLPTEADLCNQFGVSRTAVREAVKMLSAKGLISSKPRQGISVQPEEEWNIFDSDLLQWSLEASPSMQVLKEFLQMRIAIEPEAAALSAKIQDSANIEAIENALENMRASGEGTKEALEADIDFHVSILYASKNRFFICMREFVRTALNVSIAHTNTIKADHDAVIDDHYKVLEAIKSGNVDHAKNTMHLLIDEAINFLDKEITLTTQT